MWNSTVARTCSAVIVTLWGSLFASAPATAADDIDPFLLSPEQLLKATVTSVSKSDQTAGTAASAVYVITHDDIVRSGATSVPEMLRLAPNLFVAQTSASGYVITARGFSGSAAAQNFSDKLLVLIDGRSVYNPLFSGMYWDMQDVLPENIERIEVISGPGATMWGANAVNGVINIVTRAASSTQGGVVDVGYGNLRMSASAQYGGMVGDAVSYRAYVKAFSEESLNTVTGSSARDGWSKPQGGFRVDWAPEGDHLTVQGDAYAGREDLGTAADLLLSGGNVQATWRHEFGDGASLQILAYYDNVERMADDHNGGFTLDTYNLEAQHNFSLGAWNRFVVGAGLRISDYDITDQLGSSSLLFRPASGRLNLSDAFIQDQISLDEDVDLILGLKVEDDPFTGIAALPTARLTWRADDHTMFWGSISRAIRSATPFDTDVVEKLGSTVFITGNPDFHSETLVAYEMGYRGQPLSNLSLSISLFDSEYDDLKTIEITPITFLPLIWGNRMAGRVYGVETWGDYQAASWWRLSAGLTLQNEDLHFKPGASQLTGIAQAGNDPHHQATLRSSMNLSDAWTLDADLRHVGELPNPQVPAYTELNARLAWKVTPAVQISLSGFNLLNPHHVEFSPGDAIERSAFLETRWKF